MENIFSLKFWFKNSPGSISGLEFLIFLMVVLLFVSIFTISKYFKDKIKCDLPGSIHESVQDFAIWNLVFAGFIFFVRYELIPIFSMRFWYFIWLAGIVFHVKFIKEKICFIKKTKAVAKQKEAYQKYIPKNSR